MNRTKIAILGATVTLLGLIGFWWYAQVEMEKEVRQFVLQNDLLADSVQFEEVSYNPLSSKIEIEHIRVDMGPDLNFELDVDSLVVMEWEKSRDVALRQKFQITGIRFNLLELVESLAEIPRRKRIVKPKEFMEILRPLLYLGYRDLNIDLTYEYVFDPDIRDAEIFIGIDAEEIGQLETKLKLSNVKRRLLRVLSDFSGRYTLKEDIEELIKQTDRQHEIESDLKRLALVFLHIQYDDAGLGKRIKQAVDIVDGGLPGEPSPSDISEEELDEFTDELAADMPREIARSYAEAVAEFIHDLDSIELTTNAKGPVRFSTAMEKPRKASSAMDLLINMILLTNVEIDS